jgi:cytidylate kinase
VELIFEKSVPGRRGFRFPKPDVPETAALPAGLLRDTPAALPEVGELASLLSAVPEVRKGLLQSQQKLAEGGDLVTEGRDMGSVVFPGAEFKFFLDASLPTRTRRRQEELAGKGKRLKPEEVEAEISARDARDRSRKASPLVVPAGAVVIDTTGLEIAEVVETMLRHIAEGSEKRHGFPNRHSRESGNPGK